MKKPLKLITVFTLTAMLFTVISCDKEPVENRPDLPPLESLVMDFADFTFPPGAMKNSELSYVNFVYSYTTISFWSASAVLVSALPVAAYMAALTQTPEFAGDNTWEWAFDFSWDGQDYVAVLTGARMNNEEFSLEMVISPEATPDQGTLWFDGLVRYDHTSADWTFYKEGTTAVLEIDWNKDFETEEASLTYTFTEPDQTETGSYIMWEYKPGELYDAAYTISMSEGMINIEWNTLSIAGRVKAPSYFDDENWHCWDSYANQLVDMECE